MPNPVNMATLQSQLDSELTKAVDALVQSTLIGISYKVGREVNSAVDAELLDLTWSKTIRRALPNLVEDYVEEHYS